jgi:hypothetical protein
MSAYYERREAVEEFKQFIATHRAAQVRHVNPFQLLPYPQYRVATQKTLADVLDVFLALRPKHKTSRFYLITAFSAQPMFTLSAELWNQTEELAGNAR